MAAVACMNCKALVDTNDPFCKKCNEKKPFQCSKCEERLATHQVFEPEKLVLKKPIFCVKCGQETSHVKCANCKTNLVRSAGRERTGRKGELLVYHEDCWKTYEMQVKYGNLIRTFGIPILALLFGVTMFLRTDLLTGIEGAIGGAALGIVVAWMVSPKN